MDNRVQDADADEPLLEHTGENAHIRPPSTESVESTGSSILQVGSDLATKYPIAVAIGKFTLLVAVSLIVLGIILATCLPPVDEQHKDALHIPKSIQDLKTLTETFKFYTEHHYAQVMLAYTVIFLFIQAFSIPGTFYMSIMGGALFGVVLGLILVCTCIATGALLSYYVSSFLGTALFMKSEKWRHRLVWWRDQIQRQGGDNLLSYMVVLRMSPVPPHLVVNMLAPHLGIPPFVFWLSTWLGVVGISFIYVQIGSTLDKISGEGGLHLFTWSNALGLLAILVCALIPVYIRRRSRLAKAQHAFETEDEQQLEPLGRRFAVEEAPNDENIMAHLARQARVAAINAANAASRAADAAAEFPEADATEFDPSAIQRPESTFGMGRLSQWWKGAAPATETEELFVHEDV